VERVGFLRESGRAFQTVGPDTENDREPMDSLTKGTASLLWYDNRRRQLDLLCMTGVHSSVRFAGARPFRQRWTVTAVRNWIRSGMSNQCSSCLLVYVKPRSYFRELEITRAAALVFSSELQIYYYCCCCCWWWWWRWWYCQVFQPMVKRFGVDFNIRLIRR